MTGKEQDMIEDYDIESSVWIGGKRIVLGINEGNKEKPRYMSCIVTDNGLFGRYEGITTDDYFEALKRFGGDIEKESSVLELQQKIDGLKNTACLTPKDVIPIDWHNSIKECTVAIRSEVLSEGCRNIGNQLYYIISGFGAEASSRGSACYGWNLCRRKYERIERSDVIGFVPETLLPNAAKQTLEDIHCGRLKYKSDNIVFKQSNRLDEKEAVSHDDR